MNKYWHDPIEWQPLIPDIEKVIAEMEKMPILSVGITPYTRITPSFFLKNYSIYTIQRSTDVESMETAARMHVLEDHFPNIAKKVHGTGYLIGNFAFQNFLKSMRVKPLLMINTLSEKIIKDLEAQKLLWIGNNPVTYDDMIFKGSFRKIIKESGLASIESFPFERGVFLNSEFNDIWSKCGGAFVIQRGDKEVGGNEGTFFIHKEEDFNECLAVLIADESFSQVIVTPFIDGYSLSMLGCITEKGVLSGPLQLQLIDVPQSLHGIPPNGIFFGNDIGFRDWTDETESEAQKVVETIGKHMSKKGYKGIFGIDFLYDKKRKKIFPIECNPRFTGSVLLYSLMLLEEKVPPMEFFHLLAHLNIKSSFDFEKVNRALKTRRPCSHISFSPKGISKMGLPLLAGVYSYDPQARSLSYKGQGVSLADLENEHDFLAIDTVPRINEVVQQTVPRLFKFIFQRSIAISSHEVDPEASFLIDRFAKSLIKASKDE